MYIYTDRHAEERTVYQTNRRTEDKMTSTMIYNHKTHRQKFGIHASKLVVRPTVNINSFLGSRKLQCEQSDILHKTYPLHILLEFDLGILRKYSECIKNVIIISTASVTQISVINSKRW